MVTNRHDDFGDGFKESVESELKQLQRFYSHIIDASVILDKQNSNYTVEILIHVPGSVITSTHQDYNPAKAIDIALEKVKVQLKKLHSKVVDHRIITAPPVVEEKSVEKMDDVE